MNTISSACFAALSQLLAQCGANAADVMPVWQNDTAVNTLSFNDTFGHQVSIGTYNPTTGAWSVAAGSISVGATFTGGLLSIGGSPVTGPTGTFAFTVAGTSGGVPYFSGAATWASSAALAANQIVLGGGAGAAPSTPIGLGITTQLLHGNASGPPAFGPISSADVTAVLASPPPIGATAANSGAFTTLSATPVAASLGPGYSLTQSLAGSPGGPFYSNPMTLTFGALANAGFNNVGFGPTCIVSSASYSGQLFCNYSSLTVSTLGTPGYPNDQFVGNFSMALGSANTADADASIFAGNDNVQLTGTGWTFLVGREIDVTATKAIVSKFGLRIVQGATDSNQGSTSDAAIWLGNNVGASNWVNGISFDATTQKPVASAGTFIKSVGAQTVANGIDWSSATFTGNIINAPNFLVDHTGMLTVTRQAISMSGGGDLALIDSGAGTNLKNWQMVSSGGIFALQTVNDANNAAGVAISCTRIAFAPSVCTFGAALVASGGLQANVSANAAVATVLGSVGPTGSHTAVQEWLQIEGTGGAVRYVPGF
jgi:hypothetical protein